MRSAKRKSVRTLAVIAILIGKTEVVNYDGTMLFRHPMLLRPTTDGQGQRFEDPATIELQEFLASFV